MTELISEPGIYDGLDEALYHSGEWLNEPSLSVSGAKRLLRTSPAQWKWEQENRPVKQVWDFGHLAHARVLGVGAQAAVYPAEVLAKNGAASTIAAKEWAAQQRDAGLIPVKPEDMAVIDAMALALEDHREAKDLLSSGRPEVSMSWRDPETKALLRGRVDWLTEYRGTPVAVDYKTCDDANPAEFQWDVKRFGYAQQDSWYREMLDALTGTPHGFLFIAQSKTPPYLPSVVQLTDWRRQEGTELNREARALWVECMTRDEWPAYPGITTI